MSNQVNQRLDALEARLKALEQSDGAGVVGAVQGAATQLGSEIAAHRASLEALAAEIAAHSRVVVGTEAVTQQKLDALIAGVVATSGALTALPAALLAQLRASPRGADPMPFKDRA